MRIHLNRRFAGGALAIAIAIAIASLVQVASAQGPSAAAIPGAGGPVAAVSGAAGAAPVSIVVTNPAYIAIPMEIAVNRPAAEVWKRVGKYCDIGEWLRLPCTITSGKDGEVGSVRSIGSEVLVGKTELSYTYTQPVRAGRAYNLYHGTLEARPVTATTSKLVYTLTLDNSMLADDAARDRDKAQRTTQFTQALENMKILAEGGTLPPAPPRPAGGQPGAARPQ